MEFNNRKVVEILIFIYDGSFEGMLTAIFEAYYQKLYPDKIQSSLNNQLSFVDNHVVIKTDSSKADRVYHSILNKISQEALELVYRVFLSNYEDKETLIYRYLRLGWKIGGRINLHLSDETVLTVHKVSQRVGLEAHRFTGFVRFRVLEGDIYYSSIEPDNNILELLAPHFAERYCNQKWIIHDLKRDQAVIHDMKEWRMLYEIPNLKLTYSEDEESYQKMWKEFFKTIAVETRSNPRQQKSFMPVRYWKNILELN